MTELPQILLVPVDGSQNSNAAAAYAARMAEKLDAQVRLLHAFPETAVDLFGWPAESETAHDLTYLSTENFDRLRDKSAKSAFSAARKAIGETSATIDEQIISGTPSKAIVNHAAHAENAMLVMGRRGLSQLGGMLIGSTTQRVMHHAKCPVLVIQ